MNGENIAVGDKFNYLGELSENTGGVSKQQTLAKEKGC
jgi:hypothetical protein